VLHTRLRSVEGCLGTAHLALTGAGRLRLERSTGESKISLFFVAKSFICPI